MIGDLISPTHLLFVLVVALIVLGPKRLPEVGRSLGKGLRDFRSAMSGIEEHTRLTPDETPAQPPVYEAAAPAPPAVTETSAAPAATPVPVPSSVPVGAAVADPFGSHGRDHLAGEPSPAEYAD